MKKLKEDDRDWSDDDAFNKWRISIGMTLHIEINAAWDAWRHLTQTPPAQEVEPVAWVEVADSYEGPYDFHGIKLLPIGKHNLYTHPQYGNLGKATFIQPKRITHPRPGVTIHRML